MKKLLILLSALGLTLTLASAEGKCAQGKCGEGKCGEGEKTEKNVPAANATILKK